MADRRIYLLGMVAIFMSLLLYLFFFNYGLDIQIQEAPEEKAFITNTSYHRIENIQITLNDKVIMNGFPLDPNQTREIPLVIGKNLILASAQNHLTAQNTIFKQAKVSELYYTFEMPTKTYRGINFTIKVDVCNKTEKEKEASLELIFDRSEIKGEFQKSMFTIPPKDCITEYFDITALKLDIVRLYFIFGFGDYTETIIKEIEVI